MSSPARDRSMSRGRSATPARTPPAAEERSRSRSLSNDRPNGNRNRSRTRSRSPSRSRSRNRSYRSRSDPRSRSPTRSRSRSPSAPRSAKIVIEKLTKNVHSAHLREIFSTYGPISELEMPMNKQFMTNRGIAYILYSSPDYAEAAIAHMHEAQLDGALISVSIVLPRRRFSRSPPPRRPPPNRFGEPHRLREAGGPRGPPTDRAYGRGPPPRASPGFRRSPGPSYRGGRGGGGGGYRDRYDDRNTYRPRSYSPSRSPPRRRRSPSRSRSPRRESPGGFAGGGGGYGGPAGPAAGGRRRRSPSYSDYGSRSRSRDRGRR